MSSDPIPTLVVVDDDPEDLLLVKTAVKRAGLPLTVEAIHNGNDLMTFLTDHPEHWDPMRPTMIILLDLNMPGKDGRSCLRELKAHPAWSSIPIVIFSTSDSPEDIQKSYELHANSYICKPDDLTRLERIIITLYRYWFGVSPVLTQESSA
ncbi:response regulator [Saccharospirillum salsuginis]|uniref:Response regulator n=1 Tax=Saccharospirillum salsuginis TaxID=418750 RepID=A0A918KRX9_9GAMM|nr:response regulator [Saccharospirillum salsuginis]GGX72310.1 response regulator [Saccharospirillum salsuginis]